MFWRPTDAEVLVDIVVQAGTGIREDLFIYSINGCYTRTNTRMSSRYCLDYLTGRAATEQLHLPLCWVFLTRKEILLFTLFGLFQHLPAILLENCCLWIVFLECLGSRLILLHCPSAGD